MFVCNRLAMYLKENGSWWKDDMADCLKDPADTYTDSTLKYFRKVGANLGYMYELCTSSSLRVHLAICKIYFLKLIMCLHEPVAHYL